LIHQSALNDLKELDESVYKESLIKLINYVIEREY
jgi:geranylgeranyl pyrophosphate synthase